MIRAARALPLLPRPHPHKMVLSKALRVWRKTRPRSVLLESKQFPDEALLFESGTIAVLSSVEADIIRRAYRDCAEAYGCLGVLRINSGKRSFGFLVLVTKCRSVGKIRDAEVFRVTQATLTPLNSPSNLEMVQDVGKLLASGHFYFSHPSSQGFDLLRSAQSNNDCKENSHFFWNRSLFVYLRRFGVDCERWLFRVMCGNVEIQTVYAGEKQVKAALISRISCERAGTRFNVRGTNDEGHVGNFVETELALYTEGSVASFVQTRGLVPLFWEQISNIQSGGVHKIKFSRGYTCSQPAFERHFEWCLLHYGPQLCVNLLGQRNQENALSYAFQEHLQELESLYCVDMVCFDYHYNCRGGSGAKAVLTSQLLPATEEFILTHGFFLANGGGTVAKRQTGTMRSNCLDCLDRTNHVQTFFALHLLPALLAALDVSCKATIMNRFEQVFTSEWTRSGDALSQFYAGSRALAGKTRLRDGARSVQRAFVNNFLDSGKQEAITTLLLGTASGTELAQKARALLDPADVFSPLPLQEALCERWKGFTAPERLRVCVGTWNVNGGRHLRSIALKQSLEDWLLDAPFHSGVGGERPDVFKTETDVVVVGFQELVGLTASNIVSPSPSNRKEWGEELQRVLSRDHKYVLLTAEQLVGICLYVFIRPKLIPCIRDVGVCAVKTGMSGKVGNKGAVGISFLLHSTSLCFVCAHLAAHQSKVVERNSDYLEICKRTVFGQGQSLDTCDYVFWCGDFNYRIDLPNSVAKDYILQQRWDNLCRQEQLIKQKKLRKIFHGYVEGSLTFAPTYKYDQFSDDYDTSEKCRTPAWCDRVLWKRKTFLPEEGARRWTPWPEASSVDAGDVDFGLHPSDAAVVYVRELEELRAAKLKEPAPSASPEQDHCSSSHVWHPGRLLFYGRAELKTSDHRPVVALLEVDVYRIDYSGRSAVHQEVVLAHGPPDATVLITEQSPSETELKISSLLDALKPFGDVILVRAMDDFTLVTFRHSPSALAALTLNNTEVDGVAVSVCLRSQWPPVSGQLLSSDKPLGARHASSGHRLKVLTSEALGTAEMEPEEDDIMEISFGADDEGDREQRAAIEVSSTSGRERRDTDSQLADSSKPSRPPAPPVARATPDPTPVPGPPPQAGDETPPADPPKRPPRPLETARPGLERPSEANPPSSSSEKPKRPPRAHEAKPGGLSPLDRPSEESKVVPSASPEPPKRPPRAHKAKPLDPPTSQSPTISTRHKIAPPRPPPPKK